MSFQPPRPRKLYLIVGVPAPAHKQHAVCPKSWRAAADSGRNVRSEQFYGAQMLVASSSNKPPSGRFHGPGRRGHALDRHERVPIVIREGHVVHDAALRCQARQLLPEGSR